jgi:hypothetical protein
MPSPVAPVERTGARRRPHPAAAAALAWALILGGCRNAEPAPAPAAPRAQPLERLDAPMPPANRPAPHPEMGDPTDARRTARLVAELDNADSNRAYFAAVTLLSEWAHAPAGRAGFQAIVSRLQPQGAARLDQQRTIIKAIGQFAAVPGPSDAEKLEAARSLVPLLAPFLGNADKDLRAATVDALAALDALQGDEQGPDEVDALITATLDPAKNPPPTVLDIQSALRLIGRKPAQYAIPRLIDAIDRFSKRLDVKAVAFEELHSVTGQDFRRNLEKAKEWWARNRDRRPDEWYRERIAKTEELARVRGAVARDCWLLWVNTLRNDQTAYFTALRDWLNPEKCVVPEIRADAARLLAETGTIDAFGTLVDALQNEKDLDVVRQIIEQIRAMAEAAPEEPLEARVRAARAIIPRTSEIEKDVRTAAVSALAFLGVPEGIPPLVERLQSKDRDPDVAIAVLQALSRLGAKMQPRVVAEIDAFLKRELTRDAKDPLRDTRLLKESANALANMAGRKEIAPGSPEAKATQELLVQLLEFDDGSGAAAASTRQVAALALGKLGARESLEKLYRRLDDKVEADDSVATYAARAIGDIASNEVPPADRERAIAALRVAFDGRRESEARDAIFEALRTLLRTEPVNLALVNDVADKLALSNDAARVARLLKAVLPEKAPAGAETLYATLREKYANALGQTGKFDEADRIYAELLKGTPPPSAADQARLWEGRKTLIRRLIVDAKDAAQAASLAQRMLSGAGPLAPPPEYAAAIRRLLEQIPGTAPVNAPGGADKAGSGGPVVVPGGFQERPPGGDRP